MSGTLFVVATPIGNLEDITLRALRVLREVDLIACEDTRQTAKLLNHYQIEKPTTSYHDYNEIEKADRLLAQLQSGKTVALVSDAGTPCISDPGYRIVRASLEAGIRVIPLPGPCAFVTALSACGRPTDLFTFLGFLPSKKGARRKVLESLKTTPGTLVFYETAQRIVESLQDVEDVLGTRSVTIAREMTKVYEEIFFGSTVEAIQRYTPSAVKGEIVLIIERASASSVPVSSFGEQELRVRLHELVRTGSVSKAEAIKQLAQQLGTSRRDLYQLLLSTKKE
jgi:16S rRNA (cytidine1402-2'-O)-methyltransferase